MDREMQERKGFGSVKAALELYGERKPGSNFRVKNSSEKPSSRIAELQETRRDTGRYSETTRLADTVKSQAESELSYAHKTVKELRQWIEESNARKKDTETTKNLEDTKLMNELENSKQELSRLKQCIDSVLEDKRRAENEIEASKQKVQSCSGSGEALMKEIERVDEEHVLVELARLEAVKEREAIEAQREEAAKKHSAKMEDMIQEIDSVKELETRLAITSSEINVLENELRQVKELKAEKQESKASLEIVRNELRRVTEEAARWRENEAKTESTIQNLNSKLIKGKLKLESASSSKEKAESIVSNLSLALEQFKTEAEASIEERRIEIEKTKSIRAEIKKTESEIDLTEKRFRDALQELKRVNSSEKKALERLKSLSEKTMRNRTTGSTITLSTFEYEYLTGSAIKAAEVADKKVEAARAWVEALKASENEILLATELAKRGNKHEMVVRTEESNSVKRMVERELTKWNQRFEKVPEQDLYVLSRKGGGGAKFRSSATRHNGRSISFSLNRRKVMPNLAKVFSGKSVD